MNRMLVHCMCLVGVAMMWWVAQWWLFAGRFVAMFVGMFVEMFEQSIDQLVSIVQIGSSIEMS